MAITAAQQASYTTTVTQPPQTAKPTAGLPGLAPPPGSSGSGGLAGFDLGNMAGTVLLGSANLFGAPTDLSFQDALTAFSQFQAGDPTAAQIQNDLLVGGFYPKGAQPIIGTVRNQDITALKNALLTPARAGADVGNYLQSVADTAQQTGPLGSLVETTTHAIDLADPNAVGDTLDQMYEKALGRKAKPNERAAFTAQFQDEQKQYYQSVYSAQDAARKNYLQADAGRQQIQAQRASQAATAPGQVPVSALSSAQRNEVLGAASQSAGVSPEDADAYGTELAGKYGLTVTSWKRDAAHNAAVGGASNSDHLTGMAVDIASNPSDPRTQDKLNALATWAHQNEGPGKLFRWVGWEVPGHYDHVHLSFNGQVTDPASFQQLQQLQSSANPAAPGDASYSTTRDTFLGALRQVEDGGSYNWDSTSQAGAKGAYQFMPGTWATAARLAGIDANDHSPQAQDAAARALVDQYMNTYHDWSLVAAAWNGGVGTANRIKADPSAASRISDGNITVAEYMQRVMGAFSGAGGMNGGTGPANDVLGVPLSQTITRTNPDLTADALANARQQNPVESAAHDMATSYDAFSNLLGRVVAPQSSVDPRLATQPQGA